MNKAVTGKMNTTLVLPDVYKMFGADHERHDFLGELHIKAPLNNLKIPTVTANTSEVKCHLTLEGKKQPVMIYTFMGLGYRPNLFGPWGTFVLDMPARARIIDGDAVHPLLNATEVQYTFNLGSLKNHYPRIQPLYRFAVQALVVYKGGVHKFTGWDFLEIKR